jgi:hypothetical protein
MALDLDARLRAFFASAPSAVHVVQVLELSHPAMTRTYYLWREPRAGEVVLENGRTVAVECLNFDTKLAGTEGHLDQVFQLALDLTDHMDELREELDLVPIDTDSLVTAVFREYLSDDLSTPLSQARLQVESISYIVGTATLVCALPRLNTTRTGELYIPRDIPMLRAFL